MSGSEPCLMAARERMQMKGPQVTHGNAEAVPMATGEQGGARSTI
jgi:hypothetical protein